ncbi:MULTISPECIES: IS5 family transposase [unclassified Variovorax]|uniref:IS5 family transposase n=1 Tax=unclassified Variovorax TaxID=663243 RepID=UPI0032E777AF
MARQRQLGDESKAVDRGGRPPALLPEQVALLLTIVSQMPHATLDELASELEHRGAVRVCAATIRRALRAQGIVRLMPKRKALEGPPPKASALKRYGYTGAHRREAGPHYSTDLTDAEWALIADLFERPQGERGAPPRYERRHLVDACCYVLRTGCAWRLLPVSFAPWQAVYKAFVRWVQADAFERMQDRLRQQWRVRMGRNAEPTAAIIDAQSTRSSPQGGDSGFDAGKKVKGRKRHLVVDTLGLLLAVTVTAANVQDRDGAAQMVGQACAKASTIERLYTDGAYGGKCAQAIEHVHGIRVEVVRRPGNRSTGRLHDPQQSLWPQPVAGFVVLPKRWVVERTHAWNERWRRMVMHHDRNTSISTAWVWLAEARILLSRLANFS